MAQLKSTNVTGNLAVTGNINGGKILENGLGVSTLPNTIKSLSISGRTITYTKGDGTTGTLTTQDTTYSLPKATDSALGGIKIGYTDGTVAGSSIQKGVKLDSNNRAYVEVTKENITGALGYTPASSDNVKTYGVATDDTLGLIKTGYSEFGNFYAVKVNNQNRAFVEVPLSNYATTSAMSSAITSALGNYLPKSGGTIEGKTVMKFTESAQQDNILSVLSTQVASGGGWKGRLIVGAKDKTFLLGAYNNMCAIGAHKWSDAFTASGAAWEDIYFNPDGSANVYIGGSGWRAGSGTMKIANAIGEAFINTGTWASPTWSKIATQTWVENKGYLTSIPIATSSVLGGVKIVDEDLYGKTGGNGYAAGVDHSHSNYAVVEHSSLNGTYGLGTTSLYGHVKLQTGDMNGTTNTNGIAAGLGHTHSNYLTLSGGTLTSLLTLPQDKAQLQFRGGHASYDGVISYQTAGNEAMVFSTKNVVTSFMFVNGEDTITNVSSTRWKNLTPGLQIKNNKVSISKLITDGTTPTYNLDVGGTANATTIYENGTALSDKYQAKGSGGSGMATVAYDVELSDGDSIDLKSYINAGYKVFKGFIQTNDQVDETITISVNGNRFTFSDDYLAHHIEIIRFSDYNGGNHSIMFQGSYGNATGWAQASGSNFYITYSLSNGGSVSASITLYAFK